MFNAYQTDLPRKVDFVDEVERWKIRWALVDNKPDILHATNRDLYPAIYTIISILLTMPVSSATSERPYLRSTIGDERLSNLLLMHIHIHVQVNLNMIIDDFS